MLQFALVDGIYAGSPRNNWPKKCLYLCFNSNWMVKSVADRKIKDSH